MESEQERIHTHTHTVTVSLLSIVFMVIRPHPVDPRVACIYISLPHFDADPSSHSPATRLSLAPSLYSLRRPNSALARPCLPRATFTLPLHSPFFPSSPFSSPLSLYTARSFLRLSPIATRRIATQFDWRPMLPFAG